MDINQLNFIEINNVIFVSALAHELRFTDGSVLKANPELAKLLNSIPKEEIIPSRLKVTLVKTKFYPNPENEKKLIEIQNQFWETYKTDIYFVGSIVAVQTKWSDIDVVSPITTPETTRLPPDQKICYLNKWNQA